MPGLIMERAPLCGLQCRVQIIASILHSASLGHEQTTPGCQKGNWTDESNIIGCFYANWCCHATPGFLSIRPSLSLSLSLVYVYTYAYSYEIRYDIGRQAGRQGDIQEEDTAVTLSTFHTSSFIWFQVWTVARRSVWYAKYWQPLFQSWRVWPSKWLPTDYV